MVFGWPSSASRTAKRVSPSGPEFIGLCPQYTMHSGLVPLVKSLTGRSPIVRIEVFTRGWKHCAKPGSHQFGVPSAWPKRDTQRMWWRPVPVPMAMACAPCSSLIACSLCAISSSASSQVMRSHFPSPRAPVRRIGYFRRSGW